MKFLFKCWKIFHEWAQWTSEIFFNTYVNTNELPNHFTFIVFWCERRDLLCSHSNGDIFTCEDNMLFSHVKIPSFCAKVHLVFHWCFYNNNYLMSRPDIYGILGADFCLSSDVSSHGFLNALAILPTQVSRIMGALPCLKQNLMSAL